MKRLLACLLLAAPLFGGSARADEEVAVAIRYLQATGTSHAHIYLYREDGRLLRQLTRDDAGQDRDPIFSPDGEFIVFTRDLPGGAEYWKIQPVGKGLEKLHAAPSWYESARTSPYFTDQEPEPGPGQKSSEEGEIGRRSARFKSPDGTVEIVIRENANEEDDQIDGPGHGKHYLLRDLKTGSEVEFGSLPGFGGVYDLLHGSRDAKQHFLIEPPLRAAFFGLHLNSTDGDTCYALDLRGRRLVRLSPNWATPILLPGEGAFATLTVRRYVPIPGSTKTANCSVFERWNSEFERTRYAADNASICYGASIYRPAKTPAVILIRKDGE